MADNHIFIMALVATIAVALAAAPLGVFLLLRRNALAGDAVGHAILPGAAFGATLSAGNSVIIALCAVVSGMIVFALAGRFAKKLRLHEDGAVALLYLTALASGVLLFKAGGEAGHVHLEDLLFGNAQEITRASVIIAAGAASVSLLFIAYFYRALVLSALFDGASRTVWLDAGFYATLALTSVAGFNVVGTLLGVGLMIIPAIAAGYWVTQLGNRLILATIISAVGAATGLTIGMIWHLQSGPVMVLVLALIAFLSATIANMGNTRQEA